MTMTIKTIATSSLLQLKDFLLCIEDQHYTACTQLLLGASIGQHVRHVLEFYICFQEGYIQRTVNYDLRKRDYTIEENRLVAIDAIDQLTHWIDKAEPCSLCLEGAYGHGTQYAFSIDSNFERELVYNIEHAVHHMAIIKIAGTSLYQYTFAANFGVADSTIKHQTQHVYS
jgi:hypothetical protein